MLNFMFLGTNGSMQGDEGNTSLLFKGSRGTVLVDASCGLGRAVAADVDAVVLTQYYLLLSVGTIMVQIYNKNPNNKQNQRKVI